MDDKRSVIYKGEKGEKSRASVKDVKVSNSEKKVKFLKFSKKVPNGNVEAGGGDPCIVTRRGELPPSWDGPSGTVILVNKPKGSLVTTLSYVLRLLFLRPSPKTMPFCQKNNVHLIFLLYNRKVEG